MIQSTVEDLKDEIKEKVDVIVSEPLGIMLFHERMLESYIIARDRFLKPGGKMFPSQAYLCIAPFYDCNLYAEQLNKTAFWNASHFYGFNISVLHDQATREKLKQPVVDVYDPKTQY